MQPETGSQEASFVKHQFNCPVEATLSLIGGKYKPLILWHLQARPLHYMELQRRVPGATAKMLTQQLRSLEDCGMVRRKVIPEKPPKTEYSLTAFGASILPVLDAMCRWGEAYLNEASAAGSCNRQENRKPPSEEALGAISSGIPRQSVPLSPGKPPDTGQSAQSGWGLP